MAHVKTNTNSLSYFGYAFQSLTGRLKQAWNKGPAPCWMDYLHENDAK